MKRLFGGVPKEYDLFLMALTLGRDRFWRRKLVDTVVNQGTSLRALDLATGTGGVAFELAARLGSDYEVVGLDLCGPMLLEASRKGNELRAGHVSFVGGRAEELPFGDESFDAITICLALRNVTDVRGMFREMHRILRLGGVAASLDFTIPKSRFIRSWYYPYLLNFMPALGKLVSNEWEETFRYLGRSILNSSDSKKIMSLMQSEGFRNVQSRELLQGIVTLISGQK